MVKAQICIQGVELVVILWCEIKNNLSYEKEIYEN